MPVTDGRGHRSCTEISTVSAIEGIGRLAAPHRPQQDKPAAAIRLRAWQVAALRRYEQSRGSATGADRDRDFLVTATPGAGKTTFALALAQRLLAQKVISRVIVVSPTDHLRTQWAEAAERVGLALDPTLSNAVGPLRPGLDGYVTTYAQIASKPALHAARTTAQRTLVILDEVHHAGDGLSWGDAVAEAFEQAERRLCLTGTPFRTRADERIPFVRYDPLPDGGLASHADYTYSYREALADGVVRPVVFAAYTGTSRWRNSAGEVIAATLAEAGTRSTEAGAWRTALDPRGQWVPHVIAAMDERITQLRASGMPDAAGLLLASDQNDAHAYGEIVERVTGEPAVVIVSDDPDASSKISRFAAGTERIAVCVRMVSEGVDLPRAACLAWMTSYRTPLFFAQAVGRVVRARGPHESATVFLPAVRPLLTLAADLEDERNHVVRPPKQSDELLDIDPGDRVEREAGGPDGFEALEADAEFAHLLHGGRAVVANAAPVEANGAARGAVSADDEDYLGLPGLLSPEQIAALLSERDAELRHRASTATRAAREPGQRPTEVVAWRAAADLRREVNKMVSVVAARTGASHGQIHSQLRRLVPGPASAAASTEVLALRRDQLHQMLAR
jgi:superfamily II DNA or RNA helicase